MKTASIIFVSAMIFLLPCYYAFTKIVTVQPQQDDIPVLQVERIATNFLAKIGEEALSDTIITDIVKDTISNQRIYQMKTGNRRFSIRATTGEMVSYINTEGLQIPANKMKPELTNGINQEEAYTIASNFLSNIKGNRNLTFRSANRIMNINSTPPTARWELQWTYAEGNYEYPFGGVNIWVNPYTKKIVGYSNHIPIQISPSSPKIEKDTAIFIATDYFNKNLKKDKYNISKVESPKLQILDPQFLIHPEGTEEKFSEPRPCWCIEIVSQKAIIHNGKEFYDTHTDRIWLDTQTGEILYKISSL